ncbi:MAG TPA: hypothetical protein VGX68_14025 [Thermoanaerobaculia bacterium]|nr:hypothetical protein [Thermoanaerobaculia bacterium]
MEENAVLCRRLEQRARKGGRSLAGDRYQKRAADAEEHAKVLRGMLQEAGRGENDSFWRLL